MRFGLVFAALLCFITWTDMVHATHGPVGNCCMGWSTTRIPIERIVNYTFQSEGICPITAVIFHTKAGKRLCSDPNSAWAKRAIQNVDDQEKKKKALQEREPNEDGSATSITPTVANTLKKVPKNKGRNGWRRQRRKCRRGKRRQRKRFLGTTR